MSQLAISQTDYPKKAVIDGDTVCILSIKQTRTLNNVYIDRDECLELKDSLNSQISNYDTLVADQKAIISSQDRANNINESIILQKDIIIKTDSITMKKQNRKIGWLKLQRNVLGGVAVLSTGVIAYQQLIGKK